MPHKHASEELWLAEFGGEQARAAAELMHELTVSHMSEKLSANQRAALLWSKANGDRERRHTCGVYLRKARAKDAAPILGIYLDSPAMVTDFGVNKEIYLARLANVGLAVSGLEFRLSKKPHAQQAPTASANRAPATQPLEPPSPQEQAHAQELTKRVEEPLRTSLSKAIAASLARKRQKKPKAE